MKRYTGYKQILYEQAIHHPPSYRIHALFWCQLVVGEISVDIILRVALFFSTHVLTVAYRVGHRGYDNLTGFEEGSDVWV